MFQILKIKATNFVLYESLEIDFRKLEGNLIFITGNNLEISGTDSNGVGKTLIGDLICDLLFDKTIRRHPQGSFIGKFQKWMSSSIIILDTLSKKKYLINKFRNHPKHGDKVFFIEKGKTKKDLSKKRKADTYKLIWKVLNINWNTFKNRNYFGQEDSNRFLRVTDSKKADIIIDIQDLNDIQKARDISHTNIKEIKKKEEKHNWDLTERKGHLSFVNNSLKKARVQKESFLKENTDRLLDIELETKKKKEELLSLSPELLKEEIKTENNKLSKIKDKLRKRDKILKELFDLSHNLDVLKNKISFETDQKDDLTSKILQTKNELYDVKKRLISVCSKCGANLTKKRAKKTIMALNIDLFNYEHRLENCERSIKALIADEKDLSQVVNDKKKFLKRFKPQISKKEEIEGNLLKLREKKLKIKSLLDSIKISRARKIRIEKEIGRIKSGKILSYSNLIKEKKKAVKEIKQKENLLKDLNEEKSKNEFSKAVFEKTIRNLFNSFLDNLNVFCNIYLESLCDNDISVSFHPFSERKSKKVVDEIRVMVSVGKEESRDFRTYSGGEKERIELTTQLALFSSGDSNFPFLFLDEPFEGADKTGRERVLNLLQEVAEKGNKVFCVSNKVVPVGYGNSIEIERKSRKAVVKWLKS